MKHNKLTSQILLIVLPLVFFNYKQALADEVPLNQIEACTKINIPDTLDLFHPIEASLTNCIPGLSEINNTAQSLSGSIHSALSNLDIGNGGKNELKAISYGRFTNILQVEGTIRARQVTTIKVPDVETRKRTIQVPWVHVKMERRCVPKPWPLSGAWCSDVPVNVRGVQAKVESYIVQVGTHNEDVITYSATCDYRYTTNVLNGQVGGDVDCGHGALGNYKLDFSAISEVMSGQLPSLSSLLQTVQILPPTLTYETVDTYDQFVTDQQSSHSGSHVYVASRDFVNWASVESIVGHTVLNIGTLGAASGKTTEEIEGKLRAESTGFVQWLSQVGLSIASDQFVQLVESGSLPDLDNFSISAQMVNIPTRTTACLPSGLGCAPAIEKPRIGFVIVVRGQE